MKVKGGDKTGRRRLVEVKDGQFRMSGLGSWRFEGGGVMLMLELLRFVCLAETLERVFLFSCQLLSPTSCTHNFSECL